MMLEQLGQEAMRLWAAAEIWLQGLPPAAWAGLWVAAGAALIWLVSVRPTRRALDDVRGALAEAQAQAGQVEAARAALDRESAALAARCERLEAVEAERDGLRERLTQTVEARAEISAALETERRQHAARLEELRRIEGEVERKFAALAQDALGANSERFLALVTERFAQHKTVAEEDLGKRQKAIEALVKPVQDNLGKFEAAVGELEKARAGAYAAMQEQVRSLAQGQAQLSRETGKLVQALRAPKTRGRWGEFQLRQVFEMAGMMEHVDFLTEAGFETDEGRRRPDALVRLPGGKTVVVDAKTPLDAYLTALEAEGPAAQAAALADHARQLKAHVKGLASKDYWASFPEAPDFVVMFVPGEAFYSAAVEQDPTLFETALESRVLVCSPTTLIALTKSIAYGWQQERLARNVEEVAERARELYARLKTYGDHMDGVGRGLRQAVERYNKAVGALESRVLPSARRFEGLGVIAEGETLPGPAAVEAAPRSLSADELTTGGGPEATAAE